jgi:REP element-mobilizing transposase RayT
VISKNINDINVFLQTFRILPLHFDNPIIKIRHIIFLLMGEMLNKIHKRKSIRLKEYDYSQAGLYFITICCQNKKPLFGEIISSKMYLNDAGIMIEKWFEKLSKKFPDKAFHSMIVMPNHLHCIIENKSNSLDLLSNLFKEIHTGAPLYEVVRWFKTMTTNEYIRHVNSNNWQRFDGKLWQRNYWEHIIRNEQSFNEISQYIVDNPASWHLDVLNVL